MKKHFVTLKSGQDYRFDTITFLRDVEREVTKTQFDYLSKLEAFKCRCEEPKQVEPPKEQETPVVVTEAPETPETPEAPETPEVVEAPEAEIVEVVKPKTTRKKKVVKEEDK